MCSSNADDGDNYLEPKPALLKIGTLCRKCNEHGAQVVLQIRDAYCRECFLALCSHKFRGLLGKTRVLHGGKERPILVAFSGSSSSLTLLHLIQDATASDLGHRRLMAAPTAIYIDEGAVLGLEVEEREQQIQEILTQVQATQMPAYIVSLTLGEVNPTEITKSGPNVNPSGDAQISTLFSSLPDLSSKLDMLQRIRVRVLAASARKLGIDSVMLGDNATSLASAILVTISLGRGAAVPLETGFLDTREENVRFIRPLKELSSKEVAFFAKFRGLESSFIPSLLTKTNIDGSIQRLTEDFVVSLQSQFPSTVPTISRTGDKLHVVTSDETCALCLSPLDTDARDCSAMDATKFSKSLSSTTEPQNCNSSDDCKKSCGCSGQDKKTLKMGQILPVLCYTCRQLASKLNSVDLLPSNIVESIRERISFQQMKNQIQDFLLE